MMIKGLTQLMFALLATIAAIVIIGGAQPPPPVEKPKVNQPWRPATAEEERQWEHARLVEAVDEASKY